METIKTSWFLFGRQFDIPKDFCTPSNYNFNRFYCVIDGECIYTDENGSILLKPGNVYLLPRKTYSIQYSESKTFSHIWGHLQIEGWQFDNVINFEAKNDPIYTHYFNLIDSLSQSFFVVPALAEPTNMTNLFQDHPTFGIVENIFSSFISYLYFEYIHTQKQPAAFATVVDYINNNISADLSNDTLAKIAKYSRVHFIQEFKKYYHISPQKFVLKTRISHAIASLMNDEKLYVIAANVGYDTPKSFSRAFKRETGLSPQEYKEIHYSKIHTK